jgi:hypothetical protein
MGQIALELNAYEFSWNQSAIYVTGAISSFYSPATEILHTGGLVQFGVKFDSGLNYGVWPGIQCSSATSGGSGTDYNANLEWGHTWTGTATTSMGAGINNVTADSTHGATLSSGIYQVPTTNDWTNWHTVAIEYTGDSGTKHWQYYVDGTLVNSVPVTATQPTGIDFNCAFYMQMINNTTT